MVKFGQVLRNATCGSTTHTKVTGCDKMSNFLTTKQTEDLCITSIQLVVSPPFCLLSTVTFLHLAKGSHFENVDTLIINVKKVP